MENLLIDQTTKVELANFLKRPSHALLLTGPDGSGRLALARALATDLLDTDKLESASGFRLVEPGEKGIVIDQIREIKEFTRLKAGRRVIIVSNADKMQAPAQNSFLKLLEEPPEETFIILTALPASLKPTIISRVQHILVRPVESAVARQYFQASPVEVEKAFQISGGRIGLMTELLAGGGDHSLLLAADDARQILSSDRFQRLALVDQLAKDKDRALAALAMVAQMASVALIRAGDEPNLARWQKILKASHSAETSLAARANAKLVLTNLMLEL